MSSIPQSPPRRVESPLNLKDFQHFAGAAFLESEIEATTLVCSFTLPRWPISAREADCLRLRFRAPGHLVVTGTRTLPSRCDPGNGSNGIMREGFRSLAIPGDDRREPAVVLKNGGHTHAMHFPEARVDPFH